MKGLVITRPVLFSINQIARMLEINANKVSGIAMGLNLESVPDENRPRAILYDTESVDRIARVIGKTMNWSREQVR